MGTHLPRRPSTPHTGGRRSHVQVHAPPVVAAGPHTSVSRSSLRSKRLYLGILSWGPLRAEILLRPPAPTACVHTPLQSHRHS